MEKIVILNSQSGGEPTLIECLNILFPECEIEVQCGPVARVGGLPVAQGPKTCAKRGEKNGKYSDRR